MANKPKHQPPRITTKEKAAPAYIKKIEADNGQLRASLESTQNQASILQQKCAELEKENSVLSERLRGAGLQTIIKDICILIGGAGLSYFIEGNHIVASSLALVSFGCMMIYWLIANLINK